MSITPLKRPELDRAGVREILRGAGVTDLSKPLLLGRRGYYRDAMGRVGKNDIGIYDDALFLVSPTTFVAFNANTDPGKTGTNPAHGKPYAWLAPGTWTYKIGMHKAGSPSGHQALIQAAAVVVERRASTVSASYSEKGWYGVNIHRGGHTTVSSEGCQTVPPTQWTTFINQVKAEMKLYNMNTVTYVLTARADA